MKRAGRWNISSRLEREALMFDFAHDDPHRYYFTRILIRLKSSRAVSLVVRLDATPHPGRILPYCNCDSGSSELSRAEIELLLASIQQLGLSRVQRQAQPPEHMLNQLYGTFTVLG
jgi:hypothetical protein